MYQLRRIFLNVLDKSKIKIYFYAANLFRDSSMVERAAVNRKVVGSSPTRGANNKSRQKTGFIILNTIHFYSSPFGIVISSNIKKSDREQQIR